MVFVKQQNSQNVEAKYKKYPGESMPDLLAHAFCVLFLLLIHLLLKDGWLFGLRNSYRGQIRQETELMENGLP